MINQIIGLLVKTYMTESRSLGFPSCPSGPSQTRQRERREGRKRLSQKLDGRKCHELQQPASSCSYGRPSSGRLRDAANCTTRSCLLLILSESGLHGLGRRRPQSCDQRGRPVESRQCGREGTLPPRQTSCSWHSKSFSLCRLLCNVSGAGSVSSTLFPIKADRGIRGRVDSSFFWFCQHVEVEPFHQEDDATKASISSRSKNIPNVIACARHTLLKRKAAK